MAINNWWDVNYGAGGAAGGSNIAINLPAATSGHVRLGSGLAHRDPHTEQLKSGLACKNAGDFPAFIALNESLWVMRCGCALVRRAASTLAARLR